MIEIIPAIDLIDGKCIRLSQGDFAQKKTYSENPLEIAKKFAAANLKRLHIVDLDGAKSGKVKNLKILETIANNTNLVIDFSGGIKSDEDIESVFSAGAAMAGLGSIAISNAELFFEWIEKYGSEKILLGADVRGEKLAINGWQTDTDLKIIPLLKSYFAKGVSQIFVTDISRDGLLNGAATELYEKILREIPALKLTASGGVSEISDVWELERIGCYGVIIGKAIYEGRIKIDELEMINAN